MQKAFELVRQLFVLIEPCFKLRNDFISVLEALAVQVVAKWVRYLRSRGVADIPLADFCNSGKRHIDGYFADLHIAKKHKLSTMHRENDSYETLMNFAVSRGWASEDYPRAELPKWDIAEQPVNKWLYPEEIRLFIRLAPPHLRLFVAGVFATGIRGGELLYVSRRQPNYGEPNSTGISLEPGREQIFARTSTTRFSSPRTACPISARGGSVGLPSKPLGGGYGAAWRPS